MKCFVVMGYRETMGGGGQYLMDDAIDSKYSFGYTVCLSSKSGASPRVIYQDTSPHSKSNGCPPPPSSKKYM